MTIRRTKQVLAVMLVASALCADRGLAAPSARAPIESPAAAATGGSSLASRWIERLSRGFSVAVTVSLPRESRRAEPVVASGRAPVADQAFGLAHPPVSPFQFRLPPPVA